MAKENEQFTSDKIPDDWPFWDKYGNPIPDPKELEKFIPAPDIDADLNAPDEDDE
jgi:hypothetical protein